MERSELELKLKREENELVSYEAREMKRVR